MKKIKTVKVTFYSYFGSLLINGDKSGYSDDDIAECDKFLDDVYKDTGLSNCTIDDDAPTGFGTPAVDGWTLQGYPAGAVIEYIFY